MAEVFKYKVKDLPKVVYKKLGKTQSWGQYFVDRNLIEIDDRLKGKRELEVLTHEFAHHQFPDLSEDDIIKKSRELTEFLWKLHYRKVDN